MFRSYLDELGVPAGWIVLELGDPFSDGANRIAAPTVRKACEADGTIRFGVWRTRGFLPSDAANDVTTLEADLFVSEAEIPAYRGDGSPNPQAQDWPALVAALEPFGIDCAVATTWTPFQGPTGLPAPGLAEPLIDAGWYVLPYVYPAENAGATVAGALAYARHYGPVWANAEPVLGLYGGYTINDPAFRGIEDVAGFSVWDAGSVLS